MKSSITPESFEVTFEAMNLDEVRENISKILMDNVQKNQRINKSIDINKLEVTKVGLHKFKVSLVLEYH